MDSRLRGNDTNLMAVERSLDEAKRNPAKQTQYYILGNSILDSTAFHPGYITKIYYTGISLDKGVIKNH